MLSEFYLKRNKKKEFSYSTKLSVQVQTEQFLAYVLH